MEDKISVIVPIYKVEPYLDECIVSIINQTYKNLQIILVDDGSPDKCGEICDRYASQDSRITVIHKENGGLSDARNAGLKIADGAYIYFVDSDDILPEKSIEEMYDYATKKNADMVVGGFECFDYETGKITSTTESGDVHVTVMDQKQLVKDFYRDGCQAWAVLYKKHIHDGIFFPKGEINEDEAIVFSLMERVNTAVVTNHVVYSYRHRPESITKTAFSPKKLVWYKHCKDNLKWIDEHYPEFHSLALERFFSSVMYSLIQLSRASKEYKPHAEPMLQDVKLYYKDFCTVTSKNKKQRFQLFLFRYIPFGVYCNLMSMISK